MSARRGPRGAVGDVARQARQQLESVRESRWPGFVGGADSPMQAPARTVRSPQPARAPAASRIVPAPDGARPAAPEEPLPWASLEQVAEAVGGCTLCPLHGTRTNTVPGEGNSRPRLLFVGEAPGADEDALGKPFVGAAGRKLDEMIKAMGLERGEVFIANVLKCRPPGNRDPQPGEVAACIPYLRAQIRLLAPEVICTLGRPAAHALLEVTTPISRLRGHFSAYRGTPLMPTFHPSYLLRSPRESRYAWQDLQQVMKRLGLPLPTASRAREER